VASCEIRLREVRLAFASNKITAFETCLIKFSQQTFQQNETFKRVVDTKQNIFSAELHKKHFYGVNVSNTRC